MDLWVLSLIYSILGGGIASIIVLLGEFFIARYIREDMTKSDLISYLEEIPNMRKTDIWINELRYFLREKNQYISFESRHWLMEEINTIEEIIQDPQLDPKQIVTELINEIRRISIS